MKTVSDRNLKIYQDRLKTGETFSPRDLFYYANELHTHRFYLEALNMYKKFLETKEGWTEDQIAACIQMASCHAHLGNQDQQLASLFQSFIYDNPRAEVCCRLGELFLNKLNDTDKAVFWYTLATTLVEPPEIKGMFYQPHAWTWLPHMQLSVCYERIGKIDQAIQHGEKALASYPEHFKLQHNLDYLKDLAKEQANREGESDE